MARVLDPKVLDVVRKVLTKAGPVAGGAGTVVVVEAGKDALSRQEEAEKAKDTTIAKTVSQAKTKDCTKGDRDEKCKDCPPDKGAIFKRNFAIRQPWVDYQARIGGMPSGPNFIDEWAFNGVVFDGFDSSQCLLKEAKARYDQFFTRFGIPKEWWLEGEQALIAEAMTQGAMAVPRPPIVLKWYFMESTSFRYFSQIIQAAYPDIEVLFRP